MIWLLLSLSLTTIVSPPANIIFLSFCKNPAALSARTPRGCPFRADGFLQNDKKDVSIITWLTEQDHDFGELRQGKPASFTFKFKNITPDTLLLQTVRTTCGCTAARYMEEPIMPGAVGEIAIEYDAYQSGAFSKKIKVFFDKQKKAETLWIRGEVIEK
jgi:hypothetical protein